MKPERILELLARKLGKTASQQELNELDELLELNPEYLQLVSIIKSLQSKKSTHALQDEEALVAEGWNKLQQKINGPAADDSSQNKNDTRKCFFSVGFIRQAAIWGGLILLTGTLWMMLKKDTDKSLLITRTQEEKVPHGKPERRTLPDGSEVWLNSGSNITYIINSGAGTREVYLKGEAYFKVFHDSKHPFIVHAGNISVKALGTEFNVLAYPGEDKVETTLITGKVQVTMIEKPDQKIILVPNEKLTVKNKSINKVIDSSISYHIEPVQSLPKFNEVAEIAWMQDKLSFHNETFYSLSKKMGRRYNVHFVFDDSSLKNESLSGAFENESIGKAMQLLQMTTPFRYRIKADTVFISKF